MKSCSLIALLAFVTIISCLGLKPSEALADSHISEVTADDSAGKFGIGFHSTFPLSGISGKYWAPTGIGLQGFLMRAGFSVQDLSASATMLGGRFLYAVQTKPRAKFYLGAGVNYTDLSAREDNEDFEFEDFEDDEDASGLGFEGVGGVEYSFSDLPNLGFAFEFGINFLRLSTEEYEDDELNLHFTTSGTVGIHYYF